MISFPWATPLQIHGVALYCYPIGPGETTKPDFVLLNLLFSDAIYTIKFLRSLHNIVTKISLWLSGNCGRYNRTNAQRNDIAELWFYSTGWSTEASNLPVRNGTSQYSAGVLRIASISTSLTWWESSTRLYRTESIPINPSSRWVRV